MAQDATTKTAAEYDAVVAQLAALREDMAKLAKTLTEAGTRQGASAIDDIQQGMTEAARYVSQKGHDTDVRIGAAVAANPYVALMIAAGMGVLVGALTRR